MKHLPLVIRSVAAWAITLLIFFPLFWLFLTSFKTELQAISVPPLLTFTPTLENFTEVQERSDYLLYAKNSLITSVLSTVLGLLIAAPGYHGTISGLVKNALDFLEDLSKDERPYLDGRAVGLIATAYGDQATMSTLITMRAIVHALRGWPTPMGATIRTYQGLFSPDGECLEDRARMQLEMVGGQVLRGAQAFAGTAS